MSGNLIRHIPLLEFLKVAPPKVVKIILENSDPQLIKAICEISLNLCKGNIKCCEKNRKKLKRHRKSLYKLASARKSQKRFTTERRILTQKGGSLLGLIIPAALTAIDLLRNR